MVRPGREVVLSDTARVEAFSDAVLAIVITLLVLDLRIPETESGELLRGLLDEWPTYVAFVTSFLYVGIVWLNHHASFRRIRLVDRGLHWANLGVLFTTSLLPFPTAVVSSTIEEGSTDDERVAVALYALIGALLSLSWLALFEYLARHPELAEPHIEVRFFQRERLRPAIGVVAYLGGGVVGVLVSPYVALVVFPLIPIFYALTSHGLDALPSVTRRKEDSRRGPDRPHGCEPSTGPQDA
jgi:uncharacterized membrane protein